MTQTELAVKTVDILIIGAGTAGLSAAIYGLRAGCRVILTEANVHGGQIINTSVVENYPAIEEISGFDFAQNLYKQVKKLGGQVIYQKIQGLNLAGDTKTIETNRSIFKAKTVIIATGVTHRVLGVQGEDKLMGRGISFCATCDGAFFKEKTTMVVGGGNTALEDALFLANLCPKVYLVHRRDAFRGHQILADQVKAKDNIEIIYDSTVEEFIGDLRLTQVKVKNKNTGDTRLLEVDGAFMAVGQIPQNQMFAGSITLDAEGYILAGEDCKTNLPGVWCAGDCRQKPLRQLITAAADGAVAATGAAAYLHSL